MTRGSGQEPDRRQPRNALRRAKRLSRAGQQVSLNTLPEMSAPFQAIAHHTPEHEEAVEKAFNRARKQRTRASSDGYAAMGKAGSGLAD